MRLRLVTMTALIAATFGVVPAVAGTVVALGAGHATTSGSDHVEAGRPYRFAR